MAFKILCVLAALFAFAGVYNMVWKTRQVPHPDRAMRNFGLKVSQQYRWTSLGWVCFFCSFVFAATGFLVH